MRKALKGSATALFIVAVLMVQLLPGCSVKTNSDDLKTSTLLAEDTATGNEEGDGQTPSTDEGGGEGDGQTPSTGEDDNWSSCAPGTSCVDPEGNEWYTDENGVTTPYEGTESGESGGQTPSTDGGGESSDSNPSTTDEYYDSKPDENTNWDNQGGGTEIADSKEVEKQKKDMEKNIGKKMLKEWERLIKREEKTQKRLGKMIEKAEKYKEKASEDAALKFDEIISAIEVSVSNIESLITETTNGKAKLVEVQEEAKSCTENLIPGTTTWKELESAWNCTKKAEVFWMLRDAVDGRFAIEEMGEGTWEMKMEIIKMESELGTLPEAVSTLLTQIESLVSGNDSKREEGKTLYEEALAAVDNVLALTDPEEIRDAVDEIWNGISEEVRDFNETVRDDMDYFWMDDPWMIIQEAWESGHILRFIEDMKKEITFISGELEKGNKVLEEVKTLTIEKEGVKKAVEDLDELIQKVEEVLAEMQTLLEDPELQPEMMEEFWGILDGVGRSIEKDLKKIFKYFENNEDQYESLSDEVKEILKTWEEEGVSGGPGPKDKMGEVYGEDMVEELTKKIKAEVMEEVMRQISSELMESLAPYLEEDVIAGILNNLGSFSGEKGNALISNTTAVYGVLDEINLDKLTEKLKDLGERTRKALIVSTMKDALAEKWKEADAAAEADDTEEMDTIAAEIETLLNENDTLSVTGEEAYQFKDVKIDENQWYFGPVMTMKEDGFVSGYKDENGELTGEFGPENNVSIAEALKMALEAGDQQMTKTDGDHWAESAGYVDKANELGIGGLINLDNLDKAATREEIAVIVAETFELDTDVECEKHFDDYNYNGELSGHIEAVCDAEIFTGEGETGNFNGSGLINRASMAKVIDYAVSAQDSDSFIDVIDNFANTIENPTKTINTTEDKEDFEYNIDDDDDMDDMKDMDDMDDMDDIDDDDDMDDTDVDVDDVMEYINDLPDDI